MEVEVEVGRVYKVNLKGGSEKGLHSRNIDFQKGRSALWK